MKKLYIIVAIFALIAVLAGVSYLVEGIRARGFDGVNYGRVLFPAIVCGLSFWFYRK